MVSKQSWCDADFDAQPCKHVTRGAVMFRIGLSPLRNSPAVIMGGSITRYAVLPQFFFFTYLIYPDFAAYKALSLSYVAYNIAFLTDRETCFKTFLSIVKRQTATRTCVFNILFFKETKEF